MSISSSVVRLLAISAALAVAAALPQRTLRDSSERPTTQRLCQRPECSCDVEENGLESVQCDCSTVSQPQPLLLGDVTAFVSDRTRRLEVRNCSHVTVLEHALSRAISLQELVLSHIGELRLEPLSVVTFSAPSRRVLFSNIGNLAAQAGAFNQEDVLDRLEIDNVTCDHLPAGLFGEETDVIQLRISNSRIQKLEGLKLHQADIIVLENCALGELTVDVGDLLNLTITGSTVGQVKALMMNVRPNFRSTANRTAVLLGNTIANMNSEQMEMTVDKVQIINNTIDSLTAPLRVYFKEAHVTGNTFTNLGRAPFAAFRQQFALDPRFRAETATPLAFTFAENDLQSSDNGSFGLFLQPDDPSETETLFHVYGNRFQCDCDELAELIGAGDRAFLAAANDTGAPDDSDPVVTAADVDRVLYTTSRCRDDRPLTQYRLTAYADNFTCVQEDSRMVDDGSDMPRKKNAAASPATCQLLTLVLFVAVSAAGIAS